MSSRSRVGVLLVLTVCLSACTGRQSHLSPTHTATTQHKTQAGTKNPCPFRGIRGTGPGDAPVRNPTTTAGAAPSLEQATAQVARAFRNTAVYAIEPGTGGVNTAIPGSHIHITLTLPSETSGFEDEALWQADIAMGAVAELRDNGAPGVLCSALVGSIITGRTSPGNPVLSIPTPELETNAPANEYFAASTESSTEIVQSVTHTVTRLGLTVTSLRVINADGPALDLAVSARDASQLKGNLPATLVAALMPSHYVGTYVEFRSTTGTPLIRLETSARTSSGGQWVRPGSGINYPYAHG